MVLIICYGIHFPPLGSWPHVDFPSMQISHRKTTINRNKYISNSIRPSDQTGGVQMGIIVGVLNQNFLSRVFIKIPSHRKNIHFKKEMSLFYCKYPRLWKIDNILQNKNGFQNLPLHHCFSMTDTFLMMGRKKKSHIWDRKKNNHQTQQISDETAESLILTGAASSRELWLRNFFTN